MNVKPPTCEKVQQSKDYKLYKLKFFHQCRGGKSEHARDSDSVQSSFTSLRLTLTPPHRPLKPESERKRESDFPTV